MGILSRFTNSFKARANQVAEQLEDPKANLDYSLVRLEETHAQINRSLVEVSAARNRLQSQRDQWAAVAQKTAGQAEAALAAGREDLARVALGRKQEAELRQAGLDTSLTNLDSQLENLKQSQANLDHKITLFRAKKEELKAIYDSSRAQLQVSEMISGISVDLADIGTVIRRAETRIREIQSRADAIQGLIAEGVLTNALAPDEDDIDRELSQANRRQMIDAELKRLQAGLDEEKAPLDHRIEG